jgi:Protein of unknown function (DUF3105)
MRTSAQSLGSAAFVALGVMFVLASCGGGEQPPPTDPGPPQQAPFRDERPGLVEPSPANDAANRRPRGESVRHNDPPPPLAAAVVAAADTAGCKVEAFASEADAEKHARTESATQITNPPLSGAHNRRWADWGVYNQPVPSKYQVHNLEHGGIFIHYGTNISVEGVNALRTLWAKSPAYILVAPDTAPSFPKAAVVAGSWQRWVRCPAFTASQVSALEAFISEYRGRGPEQIEAVNPREGRPDGLPAPKIPDTGAGG